MFPTFRGLKIIGGKFLQRTRYNTLKKTGIAVCPKTYKRSTVVRATISVFQSLNMGVMVKTRWHWWCSHVGSFACLQIGGLS